MARSSATPPTRRHCRTSFPTEVAITRNGQFCLTKLILLLFVGLHTSYTKASSNCLSPLCDYEDDAACVKQLALFREEILKPEYYMSIRGVSYNRNIVNFTGINLEFLNGTFPSLVLTVLDLRHNCLKNISDGAFMNLQNMAELILSHNALGNEISPNLFKGIPVEDGGMDFRLALKTLHLDHNGINTLTPRIFQDIEMTLQNLYLQGNPLGEIDEATTKAITSVVYLQLLDLSDCKLSTLPQNFFQKNKHLKVLNLSSNKITEVNTLGLDLADQLQELNLNENLLHKLTDRTSFPVMKSLEILRMCRMPELIELSEYSLGNLINLEELHLCDNKNLRKIDQNFLRSNGGLKSKHNYLKKIYINNNNLMSIELGIKWELIKDFDVRGNPWHCGSRSLHIFHLIIFKYLELNHRDYAEQLKCAGPAEMVHESIYALYKKHFPMYFVESENRTESAGSVWIEAFLAFGLLVTIVVCFGCCSYFNKDSS